MPVSARLAAYLSLPFAYIVTPTAVLASTTPIALKWTAPGDDGHFGRAARYDLRYSTNFITVQNFSAARAAQGLPTPSIAGATESYTLNGLASDTTYFVAIRTVDENGNWSGVSNVMVRQGVFLAAVDDSAGELSFRDPWPNPAHHSVNLVFRLPQSGEASVDVFDVTGRHVCTLASGWQSAGPVALKWNLTSDAGQPVASGNYMLLARAGGMSWTRRLVVLQ
jgi:hypothetical protein